MRSDYEKRMLRVLEYIHKHPADDLSLDALADVAAMSRFHWHRVFHAMTGETCAVAVRRIRLNRAACWLLRTEWPVAEVAKKVGYPSAQSFSRAFRATYGMTPVQFRKSGKDDTPRLLRRKGESEMFEVKIEAAPARRLASIRHRGPYVEIGNAFEQAGTIIGAHNLWPQVRCMVGVYYDDPSVVPAPELRSNAGFELAHGADIPDGFETVEILGGPIARLRFRGPYAGLQRGYDYLFGEWLPASTRDPADEPVYEVYLNTPVEVAPADLLTDICLPLAP